MSDIDSGKVHDAGPGGVSGTHSARAPLRILAGAATEDQSNTIQAAIFPIACFKLEDILFDFDSSLPMPEVSRETPKLITLIDEHTSIDATDETKQQRPPLSIFGHADPVGSDEYNKTLSGRRAASIYGMLTRRTEVWEDLFSNERKFTSVNAGDKWGTRSIQIMLNALPPDPAIQPPPQPLVVNGQLDAPTKDALKRFQSSHGLSPDGSHNAATRKVLFKAYMDFLCVDATGVPWELDPKLDFLGQNADAAGKADFQGCGEFNPVLLFSKADKQALDAAKDHTERDQRNRPNRRVMVLLFRPGVKVSTQFWPCPLAKEDGAGCKKRFFSDAEARRSNTDEEREFKETKDTFACRFYQRLLTGSPCEAVLRIVRIRLFDRRARSLPFAPCVVTVPGQNPRADRASGPKGNTTPSAGGTTPESTTDAFIVVQVPKIPATVNVKWSTPKKDDGPATPPPNVNDTFEFEQDIVVDIPDGVSDADSMSRLQNMGYVETPDIHDPIRAFQRDYQARFPGIVVDGTLNLETKDAIKKVHDECDLVLKR